MTLAFAFLNCDNGSGTLVLNNMRGITGVYEATLVSGIYDIVAKLHADSTADITGILKKFHRISHVRSCSTMIVADKLGTWP